MHTKNKKQRSLSFSLSTFFLPSILVLTFILGLASQSFTQNLDVPYVPTPQEVVDQMLEVAGVDQGDYVIDLGSGDGRIVISAVKRGAFGHGIDLDPQRIKEARENAEKEGVSDRVMFIQENIFETDFREASVITMYLLTSVNHKLRPTLLENLDPGTRLVSHSFDMGDWEPDKEMSVEAGSSGRSHEIYFWIIPAQMEGDWSWETEDQSMSLSAKQQYQEVEMELTAGGEPVEVTKSTLSGRRISFMARQGDQSYVFSGQIEGDTINGTVQIRKKGGDDRIASWKATRK